MGWEILQKNTRSREEVAYLRISKSGISFSRAAAAEWIRGAKFAQILVDKEAGKVAFVFLSEKSLNAFAISQTGSRGPMAKITCKNLFTFLGLSESVRLTGSYSLKSHRVEVSLRADADKGEQR